jgi:hypothetical protein
MRSFWERDGACRGKNWAEALRYDMRKSARLSEGARDVLRLNGDYDDVVGRDPGGEFCGEFA